MKKILLLGGSAQQVIAIETAKKMGFYTVLCDYLPDNPGKKSADKFYLVSTTDKTAILKVAEKERVDGILAYASDPAAPTAAFVAEKMNLPTSPYKSVEILSNKDLFRKFLTENHFFTPKAEGYSDIEEAEKNLYKFKFPVIVKPVDSSGSKGVTKISNKKEFVEKAQLALSFSRSKRFIVEECVSSKGYPLAGDGFSVNGKLVFRAFADDHFDLSASNPLAPVGESWPYTQSIEVQNKIHEEIQRLLSLLEMRDGAYNLEVRLDENDNIYIMEVGPRSGGNLIPNVTKYLTGVDLIEYAIKAALGIDCSDLKMVDPVGFWGCYMVHSNKAGILKDIWIEESFRKNNLVEFEPIYGKGTKICKFNGANGSLGTMILKFESIDEMLDKMEHMERWVKVIVEQ